MCGDCIISASTGTQPCEIQTHGVRHATGDEQVYMYVLNTARRRLLTGLYDGLVNAVVERQVPDDAHNVPLDLQGVPAQLVDPLQELQTPVGHDVVAVALDLHTVKRCILHQQ